MNHRNQDLSTRTVRRDRQFAHFRALLEDDRERLLESARRAVCGEVHVDADAISDEIDAASAEFDLSLIGRLRAREQGLLNKVQLALERIEEGTFGECQDCGEAIDERRLAARPVASLCIDCKTREERQQRSRG